MEAGGAGMRSQAAVEESQREGQGEGEAGKGFQQELTRRLKGHKPWSPQSWTLMPTLPDWPWDPSKALSLSASVSSPTEGGIRLGEG